MNVEDELLIEAIRHANRAAELLREGEVDTAFGHDSLADTYRGIAHELRVGKLKRKYAEVTRSDEQLPYDLSSELKDRLPSPVRPFFSWESPTTANEDAIRMGQRFGNLSQTGMGGGEVLEGVPGGEARLVSFDEPPEADHEEGDEDNDTGGPDEQ